MKPRRVGNRQTWPEIATAGINSACTDAVAASAGGSAVDEALGVAATPAWPAAAAEAPANGPAEGTAGVSVRSNSCSWRRLKGDGGEMGKCRR